MSSDDPTIELPSDGDETPIDPTVPPTQPTIETVLERINKLDEKMEAHLKTLETHIKLLKIDLNEKIDAGFLKLGKKIDIINKELLEVKADNARLNDLIDDPNRKIS